MPNQPLSPDDPKHRNLVEDLSEEERKQIGQVVVQNYDDDLIDRRPWEEKRDKFYKLWVCQRDEKTVPWPGASNVCLPILSIACNQFHGRAYNAFFAPPRFVKAIPVGASDKNRAKNVEDFMDWQVREDMEDYEEDTDKLLLNVAIGGTNFKKCYWDSENERPVAEYVSGVDLVVPYRTRNLKTARRKTHRIWLHYDELKMRNESGLYVDFDKVNPHPGDQNQSNVPKEATQDKITGGTAQSSEKPNLILECHKKALIGQDKEPHPYIFTVEHTSGTLLRAIRAEETVNKKLVELEYFVDYHFIPNPEGYYSFGFGHFLEVLNEMANTAFNQIFDAGRLSNQPFGFYGRRAGFKKQQIKLHPGLMTELEDASQVNFPQMQRLDQVLFQVIGFIQNYAEQFSGTSDFLMGRFPKGLKNPTTGSTLGVIEQGLIQFSILTKRLFRSLKKELRLLFQLNKLYLPETKQFVVMEGEEDIAFPEIKRDEMHSIRHVIPLGDPTFASQTQRRQEAQELYQLLIQNPLVGYADPRFQLQNPRAIFEVTKDLIETYNNKKLSKLLPKLPEPPMSPDAENALVVQGDRPVPRPGQDHNLHIASHEGFKTTKHYKLMPDSYKKILDRHIDETKALQFLEAQANEAFLGGGGTATTSPAVDTLTGGPGQNGNPIQGPVPVGGDNVGGGI